MIARRFEMASSFAEYHRLWFVESLSSFMSSVYFSTNEKFRFYAVNRARGEARLLNWPCRQNFFIVYTELSSLSADVIRVVYVFEKKVFSA